MLPAHGKPFRGVNARLDQLREEHDAGLAKLRDLCRKPHRPIDVFPALFKNPVNHSNLMLATGEAIAHLNYLVENGEMAREADAAGVNWYRMVAR